MQPALFLGHGNPMHAISSNAYTRCWSKIGDGMPRPRGIVCISAHWYIGGTGVTVSTHPKTIHDFGGFPQELYQVEYPAPGDPDLAVKVQGLLAPLDVTLSADWGLDHGTWSVLRHVYPHADIPVVQLSINRLESPAFHYDIGQKLACLREQGILIVGSGNVVHNLHMASWGVASSEPYDWAVRFEALAKDIIIGGDQRDLIDYDRLGLDAALAIPTPDHYLPLLYVLGVRHASDSVSFPVTGVDMGSISMLSVQIGG